MQGFSSVALFGLTSSSPPDLAPRGYGLLLRPPQMGDFPQWSKLREDSRAVFRAAAAAQKAADWMLALHPDYAARSGADPTGGAGGTGEDEGQEGAEGREAA